MAGVGHLDDQGQPNGAAGSDGGQAATTDGGQVQVPVLGVVQYGPEPGQ